ncbi:dynamin family protein [Rudaeicoccus suwonensis]|uniref:dynamin family protein n=1 Tax=Rudaeicoccus suwonensis TaxID=657409 RepID=UPI001FE3255F|nr:dynamin family protein [Rudaeicoccus suwonensis]
MSDEVDGVRLLTALHALRDGIDSTRLPLQMPKVDRLRRDRAALLAQLDDYVVPRAAALDAPLLAVVGGSTGAGKSTLVNSIVGMQASRSGVLRPTTRASTLIHHPADGEWFAGDHVLPGLARVTDAAETRDPGTVRLIASESVPAGLALLDAPDIDSVDSENRTLARQLLSAADLWLFVTTAVRYADAVPWQLLQQATVRGTSVAVVLDRVPLDAMEEVRADLAGMLMEQGLGQSPVFAIAETALSSNGLLPRAEVTRIVGWLNSLAADTHARTIVIRRTLEGAVDSLDGRVLDLMTAAQAQRDGVQNLQRLAHEAYAAATEQVAVGIRDGSLLRGEALARWQEYVGTGEPLRQLDGGTGSVRDRVAAMLRGRNHRQPVDEVGAALQAGLGALLVTRAETAALGAARAWRAAPGGAALVEAHSELSTVSSGFGDQVDQLVRSWRDEIRGLARDQAGDTRLSPRFVAFGADGMSVLLMLVAFSANAGADGTRRGATGGSAILAQRLLESVYGETAAAALAARVRDRLLDRATELYAAEGSRFEAVLHEYAPEGCLSDLGAAISEVKAAR